MSMKYLIFSDHSILMDGILANMNNGHLDVVAVAGNPEADLLGQIKVHAPDVVFLEKKKLDSPYHCSLNLLFSAYPDLVLVEVDELTGGLQIIGSKTMMPKGLSETLAFLGSVMTPGQPQTAVRSDME